jgi:hypothetical protein
MAEIKTQHKHTGQSWRELTPEERNDLMKAIAEAHDSKVTIRQIWEAYRNGKLDATPMQRCTICPPDYERSITTTSR